jgi:hypothetical protein
MVELTLALLVLLVCLYFFVLDILHKGVTIPGGILRYDSSCKSDYFISFLFEYYGGGYCHVRAIREEDFKKIELNLSEAEFVVFVFGKNGNITDFYSGKSAFFSYSDDDWHSMRRQVMAALKHNHHCDSV